MRSSYAYSGEAMSNDEQRARVGKMREHRDMSKLLGESEEKSPIMSTQNAPEVGRLILKLRNEANEQLARAEAEKARADAAEQELARIKGAALPEALLTAERAHLIAEQSPNAQQLRDPAHHRYCAFFAAAHDSRATLLDAVRGLTAERDELNADVERLKGQQP